MKLDAGVLVFVASIAIAGVSSVPLNGALDEVQHALRLPDSAGGVIKSLENGKLIPDVIDPFDVDFLLNATWTPENHSPVSAEFGNNVRPSLLQTLPSSLILTSPTGSDQVISLSGDVVDGQRQLANAVVALTDPDAPSPRKPKNSNFCHWLQYSHIKHKSGEVTVKQLVKYMPPSPPRGTGNHRYLLVVMVPENGSHKKLHLSKPGSRKRWGFKHKGEGLREWMTENHLIPIAANYFLARYEKPKSGTKGE